VTVKAAFLKVAAIGVGVGGGLGLVALSIFLYATAPKGWNKKAITATFQSTDFNVQPSPAVYYTYTLSNNTNRDFSTKLLDVRKLPENLRAAVLRGPISDDGQPATKTPLNAALNFGDIDFFTNDLNSDGGIDQLANGEPIFIPAGQKVQVRLRWELPTNELEKYGSVKILNTSLFGFILYDDTTKYEIDFPRPPILTETLTELDTARLSNSGTPIAPDHKGRPWEKYAACQEAERLVPLCKKANIEPKDASSLKSGWMQTPLPEMALPPKGYFMEPGQEACNTVSQWQAYCKSQK
jgi:hypothetical protein